MDTDELRDTSGSSPSSASRPRMRPRMRPRPHVVIVGAGFGGLSAAQGRASADIDVTVIDQHNYHLFQPLLYQVATAGLWPSEIAYPIRAILRKRHNIRVMLGEVTSVDVDGKRVHVGTTTVSYDYLIVAVNARHSYFGHPAWEDEAPGLTSVEDAFEHALSARAATALRRRSVEMRANAKVEHIEPGHVTIASDWRRRLCCGQPWSPRPCSRERLDSRSTRLADCW